MKKITGVLVLCAVLAGCKEEHALVEEIRPVCTLTVSAASRPGAIEFSGEVRARHETSLGFRIGGKLAARLVDVGAMVRTGQVLARLDPQDQVLNVATARAQRIAVQTDLAQLRLDLSRAQELLEKKFVSQAEVDRRRTAVDAAESKHDQAKAQEQLAMNQAAYTSLLADAPGVITGVETERGQIVGAGQTVFRLARNGEREVLINVAESQRGLIRTGMPAEVRLWAQSDKVLTGNIREVAPAADPQSRTYAVRIALPSDVPEAIARLGMSATVKLIGADSPGAVTLPLSAILGEGEQQNVWLWSKKSGRVKKKAISVVDLQNEQVQVTGLLPGDVVVTAGVHLLREGQAVRRIPAHHVAGE